MKEELCRADRASTETGTAPLPAEAETARGPGKRLPTGATKGSEGQKTRKIRKKSQSSHQGAGKEEVAAEEIETGKNRAFSIFFN